MRKHGGVYCLAALFVAAAVVSAQAAPKIGVAAAVHNDVRRVVGSNAQPLAVGSDLFTNERIRTGEKSAAQILFLDKTSLTVGAGAELTLDRFVYNPSQGTGQVVLNAGSYSVKTPIGTIGVRGTIVDLIVGDTVTVILVEGSLTITVNGVIYTLDRPGTAYVFSRDGGVQGPVTWDGTIINTGADVTFPLYGWYFQGEAPLNGLPDVNLGGIDQLNAVIQRSLAAPSPGIGEGGGGGEGGGNALRRR